MDITTAQNSESGAMAKATPTSESSVSSVLADAFLRVVGVTPTVSEKAVKPSIRKQLSSKYTERVRQEAGSPNLWGGAAKSLSVSISTDDVVSVNATGTPEEVYAAEVLEYGTPSSPPRAVMRTYEAAFNEEYKIELSGYSL